VTSDSIPCEIQPILGEPILIDQTKLNCIVRDLTLSKEDAQKLGSHLRSSNLLAPGTKFSWYRHREQKYSTFYTMDENICYCSNINSLLEELDYSTCTGNWYLFMDSSSKSFKCILINKKDLKVVPLAYSTIQKETITLLQVVLNKIQYENFLWDISGDFKIINMIMGLQAGYTQFGCFLCEWRSRSTDQYEITEWPPRTNFIPGERNVLHCPLVPKEKILFPPLHIKLGLYKNFLKALEQDSAAFKRLYVIFPKLSSAKIQAGVLNGPDIKKLQADTVFGSLLSETERIAWNRLNLVSKHFLGNPLNTVNVTQFIFLAVFYF